MSGRGSSSARLDLDSSSPGGLATGRDSRSMLFEPLLDALYVKAEPAPTGNLWYSEGEKGGIPLDSSLLREFWIPLRVAWSNNRGENRTPGFGADKLFEVSPEIFWVRPFKRVSAPMMSEGAGT